MKILLADHDTKTIKHTCSILKRQFFSVDIATTGSSILQKIRQNKYELLVLEILLPDKSGFEIIASLRSLGIDIPIIVLSSRALPKDRVYALNLGADDYIMKTFIPDEFLARIKSVMRRTNQRRNNILQCGDIVLNLSNMSVQRGIHHIHLSAKELGILHTLLKYKNTIVRRKDILASVWAETQIPTNPNTLDVHIRFLREKLKLLTDKTQPIQTFRHQGYMIAPAKK